MQLSVKGLISSKIAKNTMWLGSAELITRALKFALIVYATRVLGPNGFGQFSFALAFVALLSVFSDLGLAQLMIREVAQDQKKSDDFYVILALKFVLSLLTMIIALTFAKLTVANAVVLQIIIILSIYMLATTLGDFLFALLQAKQVMKHESVAKILQAVVSFISGVLLLNVVKNPFSLGYAYVFGALSALLLASFVVLSEHSLLPKKVINVDLWVKYLAAAWPLALTGIFISVYNSIDSVMMGYYGQVYQVGLYNASYKIIGIILIPSLLIYRTFYPALNEAFQQSRDKFLAIFKNYLVLSTLIGIPILILGVFFSNEILNIIFGRSYLTANFSLKVLVVMAVITILSYPFVQLLVVTRRQNLIFWATFWGAVSNIFVNFLVIPKYSLNGAALSTLLSVSIVFVLSVFFCRRVFNEQN